MRSRFPLVAVCAFAAATLSVAPVNANTPRERYAHQYRMTDKENAGPYAHGLAGRNLAREGLTSGKPASADQLREAIGVMRRMRRPMVVDPATESTPPAYVPTVAAPSGGPCDAIPAYIVECESGCNYSAQNPSGAYGAYQIMPGTSSAYGCDMSTPEGQDACAAKIYADQGSSPWVCG